MIPRQAIRNLRSRLRSFWARIDVGLRRRRGHNRNRQPYPGVIRSKPASRFNGFPSFPDVGGRELHFRRRHKTGASTDALS